MDNKLRDAVFAVCITSIVSSVFAAPSTNEEAKLHKFSTVIEKERPALNAETQKLIAACRRNPSKTNLAALRKQIEINYDNVVARKKAKLEELKRTAKHQSKIQEMQEIVDEMIRNREKRIEQNMRRFTDPRLRPGSRQARDGFLPVLGAASNVSIGYTPVTNEEYSRFVMATGRKVPESWSNGIMPRDKARHPVVNVSFDDAVAYCKYLTEKDGSAIYRLPTGEEWEYAAGHMPKDADFNCGVHDGTTAVDAYAQTLAACGAIDMWGNVREWTSTPGAGGRGMLVVKGGSWNSRRTDCRTEQRETVRKGTDGFDDVGFRIICEN